MRGGARTVFAIVAVCFLLLSTTAQAVHFCLYDFVMQNTHRHVYGLGLTAECSGWPHTPIWGNWGVNSNFSDREDGNQFYGWHPEGSQHQWNTCTALYPPPSEEYYNFNNYTEQVGDGGGIQTYSWSTWILGYQPCQTIPVNNVVFTVEEPFMDLYELDPGLFGYDVKVEILKYAELSGTGAYWTGGNWMLEFGHVPEISSEYSNAGAYVRVILATFDFWY